MVNLEAKYRKTLLLNPWAELPELNDSEEEEDHDFSDMSREILVHPPKE